MSVLMIGECLGTTERQAGSEDRTWTERTVHVLSGVRTTAATLGKDFGPAPEAGDLVALEVAVRTFKMRDGGVGHAFTAFRRVRAVEEAVAVDRAAVS